MFKDRRQTFNINRKIYRHSQKNKDFMLAAIAGVNYLIIEVFLLNSHFLM